MRHVHFNRSTAKVAIGVQPAIAFARHEKLTFGVTMPGHEYAAVRLCMDRKTAPAPGCQDCPTTSLASSFALVL
jgi:hypothetical protein